MAPCDEGYLCELCGLEVEGLIESDLYLRFVIGLVDPETLHTTPERHIRCNAPLAQFIVADDFEAVEAAGAFAKQLLDPQFVHERETLVTRGWRRLNQLANNNLNDLAITDYPLPEIRAKLKHAAEP